MRKSVLILSVIFLIVGSFQFPSVADGERLLPDRSSMNKGDWYVDGTERYQSTEIELSGNLTVNGTLILDDVDLIVNNTDVSIGIIINNRGKMTLRNGSRITYQGTSKYYINIRERSSMEIFDSEVTGAGLNSNEQFLNGIYANGATIDVNNSFISRGQIGIISNNSQVDINGSDIHDMASGGVVLKNSSTAKLTQTNLTYCGMLGMDLIDSSAILDTVRIDESIKALETLNGELDIDNCLISSIDNVCMVVNSSEMDIKDTYFPLPGNDVITVTYPLGASSNVSLLNSTPGKVLVDDPITNVTSAYRHDIKVLTNGAKPAIGSSVTIRDSGGITEFTGITDIRGLILDIPLLRTVYNESGQQLKDPHNLTVTYENAERRMDFKTNESFITKINVILTNPEVIIESPVNSTWSSESSINLKGIVKHSRPLRSLIYIIDGVTDVTLPVGNTFDVTINFPDGEHFFTVVATNDEDRQGYDISYFGVDTETPTLTLDPLPNYYNNSIIWISGECDEKEAKVYIGEDMVPHPDGSFRYAYPLQEGRNEITIRAVDRAENEVIKTVIVNLDTTPPSVHVVSFLNGSTVRGSTIWVNGTVDISTIGLEINGKQVELKNGQFRYLLEGLVEGKNFIVIRAEDRTGGVTVKRYYIFADMTAPDIIIFNLPKVTRNSVLTIRGESELNSTVSINGITAERMGEEFYLTLNLIPGGNPIDITSVDTVGNTRLLEHETFLDIEPPVIEDITPQPESTVRKLIITVKVSIFENHLLSEVIGSLNGGATRMLQEEDGVWTWVVTLEPGRNTLLLEVVDRAGNRVERSFIYTYYEDVEVDETLPTVKLTYPDDASRHTEGEINIQGEAYDDSGLDLVQLRIISRDNNTGWMDLSAGIVWHYVHNFSAGNHRIQARAVDTSGNIGNISEITIVVVTGDEENGGEDSENYAVVIVIAVIILFLLGVLFYVALNYKRIKEKSDLIKREEESRRIRKRRPSPNIRKREMDDKKVSRGGLKSSGKRS